MPKAMTNATAPVDSPPAAAARSRSDRAAALVADDMRAVEARLAERMESPVGAIPQVGAHLLDAPHPQVAVLLSGEARERHKR